MTNLNWTAVNIWKSYIWTADKDMNMKAIFKRRAEKKIRTAQDLNLWPLRYQCSALPTELTSQLGAGYRDKPQIDFWFPRRDWNRRSYQHQHQVATHSLLLLLRILLEHLIRFSWVAERRIPIGKKSKLRHSCDRCKQKEKPPRQNDRACTPLPSIIFGS